MSIIDPASVLSIIDRWFPRLRGNHPGSQAVDYRPTTAGAVVNLTLVGRDAPRAPHQPKRVRNQI
jgi:hypothetical protein